MQDHPDPELTDQVLGSEIELLADLIDAASVACTHLDPDQIDAALGVCPSTRSISQPPVSPRDQSPSASR